MSGTELREWRLVLGEDEVLPGVSLGTEKTGDEVLLERLTAMFGAWKR